MDVYFRSCPRDVRVTTLIFYSFSKRDNEFYHVREGDLFWRPKIVPLANYLAYLLPPRFHFPRQFLLALLAQELGCPVEEFRIVR
jgi:hypothetical protein